MATSSTAVAAGPVPVPGDANEVVYPLTSFMDWAENPLQNLTDPALGEYAGSQMIEEAAAAVAKQFPTEIATAFSADPGTTAGRPVRAVGRRAHAPAPRRGQRRRHRRRQP